MHFPLMINFKEITYLSPFFFKFTNSYHVIKWIRLFAKKLHSLISKEPKQRLMDRHLQFCINCCLFNPWIGRLLFEVELSCLQPDSKYLIYSVRDIFWRCANGRTLHVINAFVITGAALRQLNSSLCPYDYASLEVSRTWMDCGKCLYFRIIGNRNA